MSSEAASHSVDGSQITPRDVSDLSLRQADQEVGRSAPLLVPAEEAAALLSVHRSTIYDLLGRGQLASVKIGRRRLIPRAALDEFIASNVRPGLR